MKGTTWAKRKFVDLFIREADIQELVNKYLNQLLHNTFMSENIFRASNPLKNLSYSIIGKDGAEKKKILDFGFSRIFIEDTENPSKKIVQKIMVTLDDRTLEFEQKKRIEATG